MTGPQMHERLQLLGFRSRAAQASFLGVSDRTLDRFRKKGPAPTARRLIETTEKLEALRREKGKA